MITNLFKVATEFKFEIGSALLSSKLLQNQVDQLSGAADNALVSFQRMGIGMAAQFGIAEIGLFGIAKAAVMASDKFRMTQLAFANILSANKDVLVGPIDTFNDRLKIADNIMQSIGKAARDFSLDETALLQFTKMTAAMLVPKGLAGPNFKNSIDISRTLLKSAPTLGVQPWDIQNQLLEVIEGRAGGNNTLFRRLVSDTDVFKGMTGKGQGGGSGFATNFNALPAQKRVELLSKALNQFAKDTDVLEGNVNTLSGQFQRLSTIITGPISSIFKPLGDVLLPKVVQVMKGAGNVLDNQGRAVVSHFAKIMEPIVENPEKLAINLMQLRALSKDLGFAAKIGSFIGSFLGLQALLKLGSSLPVVGKAFQLITGALSFFRMIFINTFRDIFAFILNPIKMFGALRTGLSFIPGILSFFMKLLPVLWAVLKPFSLILFALQTISRALAIAHVDDVKAAVDVAPEMTKQLGKIMKQLEIIFSPITETMDALAHVLAPIFRVTTAMQLFILLLKGISFVLEGLAKVVMFFKASLFGLLTGLTEMVLAVYNGKVGMSNLNTLPNYFWQGAEDGFKKSLLRDEELMNSSAAPVVNNTTNIGNVVIQNQFKEQLEPDRIAFALVDQLKRTAQNPTRGSRPGSDFNTIDSATAK